jgi:hypothetical protein
MTVRRSAPYLNMSFVTSVQTKNVSFSTLYFQNILDAFPC